MRTRQSRCGAITLEKLLAGILLEEGFVNDRTRKVVDHEANYRLNLLLVVPSIECDGVVLGKGKYKKKTLVRNCSVV